MSATILTGNPAFDAIGSLVIGALLVVVAVAVANEVKSLLVGSSAEPAVRAELRRFLEGHREISRLYHMITLQLGHDIMLATKARMCVSDKDGSAKRIDRRGQPRRTRIARKVSGGALEFFRGGYKGEE